MAKMNAIIGSTVSVFRGIPKYSLNVLRTAIKRIAVKTAPSPSIKKTIFGFKVSVLIFLFKIIHLVLSIVFTMTANVRL